MTKGRIISVLILLGVLSVFGGVYQFYFKEKLEAYSRDEQFKETLEATLTKLVDVFSGTKPDVLCMAWTAQIQPWDDAVADRTNYFNWGDWFDHEKPPRDGSILKFWYDKEAQRLVWDLYQKVSKTMGRYDRFPRDIQGMLDVATLEQWENHNVTEKDVNKELAKLSFGISVCEELLDAKASSITEIAVWPPEFQAKEHSGLLNKQTVGLSFTMTMKDFTKFVDNQLRTADRHFTINALKVNHRYIAYNSEPHLEIAMLLSQTAYARNQARSGSGVIAPRGGPPGTPSIGGTGDAAELYRRHIEARGGGSRDRSRPEQKPPGVFGRTWKWIKRNIFYTN